jgi:Amt family ammonium transporter
VGAFVLCAAAGYGLSGDVLPRFGAAAFLAVAFVAVWRALAAQAGAERLAADACRLGDPGLNLPVRASLARTLPLLAAQMKAVGHRLSPTHPVTGFSTRENLCEMMSLDLRRGEEPRLLGVVRFTDFDRLASFDQAAATSALKAFADRLRQAAKTSHVIGHLDRDCLGVWFRDETLATASAEFQAIVYVARQEIAEGESILTPMVEAACVSYPRDGADASHLLLRAAAALAQVGASGAAEPASPPSLEAVREQFSLEQDLAQAIAEEQLTMVFQPVVDLSSGRLTGAEALLRWDHPRLGAVSPARFIPIIEAIGMSERYGLWVLNAACREARRWRDDGLSDLKVAVNLSARQLLDPDLRTKIERTLQRHALDPTSLELELTETAAMADAGRTLRLFAELRAMGVSLAIDDFGSGYSSLSYLKNLPFDKLKIDREFVTDVDQRRDSQAICRALLELGRGLNLTVLAEGVETVAEVSALRALGCSVFQGYYFSKPVSSGEFSRLAAGRGWIAALTPSAPSDLEILNPQVSA